ncbi:MULTISPECIES: endonuclease/exonuclease/phosphatase family protein [unclassified Parabacteroides]|uniref:endonuclease/exonuclease/phosphatase family protein n=1 Tax=unclassified Parabacteroides TaxID=2649774 RepID=UPI002475E23E|nr:MULTISPECIES: endonuclease/exonuclease/phosphatase family protein [unclassified Parabacteroides]
MSFNIWLGGGKSVQETARVILESKADIVGIQESSRDDVNTAINIADSLGWYSYASTGSPTIISKFAITDTSTYGHGVKIQIDEKYFVWMFNIHLMYCPYEPYQLNGIHYCGGPLLNTAAEAIASARNTRGKEVAEIILDMKEAQKEGYPLFLTGDFNEPSCLDWTEKSAKAGLCKMPVSWPSTFDFMYQADMKDSYRMLYPDETANPGYTWTPLPESESYTEVLDRIDFVFFWGNIHPVKSEIVGEVNPASDIQFANYPSDHRAVISTFTFNSHH